MKNVVHLSKPLTQEIEATCSYSKEFKTNFLTLSVAEDSATHKSAICEEVTICINNKQEAKKLIQMLQNVIKKVK